MDIRLIINSVLTIIIGRYINLASDRTSLGINFFVPLPRLILWQALSSTVDMGREPLLAQ